MLDELRAKFRPRFLATARARVARARAPEADSGVLAAELHSLAGEASLLEFTECATIARAAEKHARAGEVRQCRAMLDPLAAAVEALDV